LISHGCEYLSAMEKKIPHLDKVSSDDVGLLRELEHLQAINVCSWKL